MNSERYIDLEHLALIVGAARRYHVEKGCDAGAMFSYILDQASARSWRPLFTAESLAQAPDWLQDIARQAGLPISGDEPMRIEDHAPRKVIVSREYVDEFCRAWPCAELRSRSYWFEFDADGDLIDSDVPLQDDGSAAAALADEARVYWQAINAPFTCRDCGRVYDDGSEECTSDDCPSNTGAEHGRIVATHPDAPGGDSRVDSEAMRYAVPGLFVDTCPECGQPQAGGVICHDKDCSQPADPADVLSVEEREQLAQVISDSESGHSELIGVQRLFDKL